MAESTYLQRLVSRMGMPAAPPANAPTFALPHVPLPPIYDPFAAVEPIGDGETLSAVAELPIPAESSLPTASPSVIQAENTILPISESETIREVISLRPERIDVGPPPVAESSTQSVEMRPPRPTAEVDELVPSLPLEPETVERVVYTAMEASYPELPPARIVPDDESSSELLPPAQPQIVERVIQVSADPPPPETSALNLEPPPTQDAPDATPIFATPAPQITIGEIVVEVVTQAEKSTRAPSVVQARSGHTPPAPATRLGVRSKRNFGLGQI